jgi:hypothetical protein
MSPGSIDEPPGILSVCPKCRRLYRTSGYCSHGLRPKASPKPEKPDDPLPEKRLDPGRRQGS